MGKEETLQLKEIKRINLSTGFIWILYIDLPLLNEFRIRNIMGQKKTKNQGKIKKDTYIVFLCDNIF